MQRRAASFLVLIFGSGLLLGGALMNIAEHYWLHEHAANEYDIRQHRLVAQKMGDILHFTPQQENQADAILQDTVAQYQTLEQHLAPQFDQIRQQDRDRMRAILTPEQRQDFDKLVEKVDAEYPLNERPAVLSPVPCEGTAANRPAGPGH